MVKKLSARQKAKMQAQEIADRKRDLQHVSNPDNWSTWPYCPMKRHHPSRNMECCCLWAGDWKDTEEGINYVPVVRLYSANMFNLPADVEAFKATKVYEYATFEAMLDDGWRVD